MVLVILVLVEMVKVILVVLVHLLRSVLFRRPVESITLVRLREVLRPMVVRVLIAAGQSMLERILHVMLGVLPPDYMQDLEEVLHKDQEGQKHRNTAGM